MPPSPAVALLPAPLRTRRLRLVPATVEHLRAELEGREAFAAALGAEVTESWPPGEYDGAAIGFFLARHEALGAAAEGWFGWYALTVPARADERPMVVAAAGYLGPPGPEGTVEIGYSVIPEQRGRGHASAIADALAARALRLPGVERVVAHIMMGNEPSQAVLLRAGFARVGPGRETGTLRFERPASVPGTVRRAQPDDAPAIAALFTASRRAAMPGLPELHTPADTEWFFREVVPALREVWVLEDGGPVIGFIAFGGGEIEHLYVAPGAQGRGAGARLLGLAMASGAPLELWTFARNAAARAFYEHHGFAAVEETDGAGNEEREPDVRYRWDGMTRTAG
ncbi:MAG: GNAT family N-acetyltransferase [Anaeromyxobacter sp.]